MNRELSVLLLDCDGVIRHWDREQFAALARQAGCDASALANIAFERELLQSAMVGTVTAEIWADTIGRRAGEAHGADPALVAEGFLALGWSIDETVLAVARKVRAVGHRVAILSNASTRLEHDLASAGVTEQVDAVLSSARLGLAKPDPAIYVEAAAALAVEPGECLFVDDQAVNITGAREAGMAAEVFMGTASLVTLLGQVGLL
jgi:putative hydrolase of the HAD superfamily